MNVEKSVGKYSAFRKGSAAPSHVTTRVHSARRSEREPASHFGTDNGREQPSGRGSGSTPGPNRGVAHAPTGSAGCEWRAADGTNRRPTEDARHSLEVAGAVTDPTAWAPWCPLACLRISGPDDSGLHANHRTLSRLPSRRQPFRSERQDQCEKNVEIPDRDATRSSQGVAVELGEVAGMAWSVRATTTIARREHSARRSQREPASIRHGHRGVSNPPGRGRGRHPLQTVGLRTPPTAFCRGSPRGVSSSQNH